MSPLLESCPGAPLFRFGPLSFEWLAQCVPVEPRHLSQHSPGVLASPSSVSNCLLSLLASLHGLDVLLGDTCSLHTELSR